MMMPSGAHGYCGTCTDAGTTAAPSPPGHRGPPMKPRPGLEPPSPGVGRASPQVGPAPRPPPRRRDSPGHAHGGQKKLAIVAVDGSVQTSPGSAARPNKPHPPPMSPGGGSISSSRPPPPPPPRRRGRPAHRDMVVSSNHSKSPSIGRGRGHGSAKRSHGTNGSPSIRSSHKGIKKSLLSAPPSPSEPTCASSGSSSASPVPASPPAAGTNRKKVIPAVPHKIDGVKKNHSPKHAGASAHKLGHGHPASNGQPHGGHDQHAPSSSTGSGAKTSDDAVVSLSNTSRVNLVCSQIYNYLEEYDAKNASPGKPSPGMNGKVNAPSARDPSSPGTMQQNMNSPSARDPSAPGTADASGSSPSAAGRKRMASADDGTTRTDSADGHSLYSNARDSSMNSSTQTHLSREEDAATVATSNHGGSFLREKWNGRGQSGRRKGQRSKEDGEGRSSRGAGRSRSVSRDGSCVGSQGRPGTKEGTTTGPPSRVRSGGERKPMSNHGRGGSHGSIRGRSVSRESVQGRPTSGGSVRSGGSRSRSVSGSRGRSVSRSDLDSSLASLSSGLKRLSTSDLRRFSSSKDDHDDEEAASYGLGRRSSTGSRLGCRSSEYSASSGLKRLSASDKKRFSARDARRASSASVGPRPRSSTDGSLSDAAPGLGRPSSQGAGGGASNDGRRSSSSSLRLRDRASTGGSVSPSLVRPPSKESVGSASSSAVHRRPSSKEAPPSPGFASSLRRRPSKDQGASAPAGPRRPRSSSLSLRRLPSRERGCPSPLAGLRRSLSKDGAHGHNGTRSTASSSTDVSECDSSIVSAMRSYRQSPGGDGTKDGKKGGRRRRSFSLSRRAARALDALDSTGSSFQDAERANDRDDEPPTSTGDDESNGAAGRDDSKASMAYDVPFDPLTGRCFHHPGVCMAVRMEEGCDENAGLDRVDSEAALVGWKVVRTACPKCTYNY